MDVGIKLLHKCVIKLTALGLKIVTLDAVHRMTADVLVKKALQMLANLGAGFDMPEGKASQSLQFVLCPAQLLLANQLGEKFGAVVCQSNAGRVALEDELQPVLRSLLKDKINIVAIHQHMTHEQPRMMFFHYWGRGRAKDLANAIKGGFLISGLTEVSSPMP